MATATSLREKRARQSLVALAALASVAVVTATGLYSYPETLAPVRGPLVFLHDVSGDAAVIVSALYLYLHLSRTWRMKKQRLSRYSGLLLVGLWAVTAVTGVYGQLFPLAQGTWSWRLHVVTSIAIIVLACFHGAWAYRPRKRPTTAPDGQQA